MKSDQANLGSRSGCDLPPAPVNAGPVMVSVPRELTGRMMRAVRDNPLTSTEDNDEWHRRLGWLTCAWEVLLDSSNEARVEPIAGPSTKSDPK